MYCFRWLLLLPTFTALVIACGSDNNQRQRYRDQLDAFNQNRNNIWTANRTRIANATRDPISQALLEASNTKTQFTEVWGKYQARHGLVTVRGVMVQDSKKLKTSYESIISVSTTHGKFDGSTVKEVVAKPRKIFTTAITPNVRQSIGINSAGSKVLTVGCVTGDDTDKEIESLSTLIKEKTGVELDLEYHEEIDTEISSYHYDRHRGVNLSGKGYFASAHTVILCGTIESDIKFIEVRANNLILKSFSYFLDGDDGYKHFEAGANKLFLIGSSEIKSQTKEGGQIEPPAIRLEIGTSFKSNKAGGKLSIIATGTDIKK